MNKMVEPQQPQQPLEISDEEALMKIAQAMKDNAPTPEDKQSIYTFLFNVATAKDTTKIGNLRVEKEKDGIDELGLPTHTVRGSKEMARISSLIMGNDYFDKYFKSEAEDTFATSLSREGFLVRQGTVQTKQIADITKRKKINKGWFKEKQEVSGGDTMSSSSSQ